MSKPVCKLTNTDGNVFSIIGNVSRALEKAGKKQEASEFREKAFKSDSYDKVLQLVMQYVEVE